MKHKCRNVTLSGILGLSILACGGGESQNGGSQHNDSVNNAEPSAEMSFATWEGIPKGLELDSKGVTERARILIELMRIRAAIETYKELGNMLSDSYSTKENQRPALEAQLDAAIDQTLVNAYTRLQADLAPYKPLDIAPLIKELSESEAKQAIGSQSRASEERAKQKTFRKKLNGVLTRIENVAVALKASVQEQYQAASVLLRDAGETAQEVISQDKKLVKPSLLPKLTQQILVVKDLHPMALSLCENETEARKQLRETINTLQVGVRGFRQGDVLTVGVSDIYAKAEELGSAHVKGCK